MIEFSLRNQGPLESASRGLRSREGGQVVANNPYTLLDRITPQPIQYVVKPKSPEMVTPRNAWRRLCGHTGCEVDIRTFYRWIGNGRLYTVRLGRSIFVPLSALETLIENCLRGESL